MKYYAVTDDPNELYHYGRKGMKWGKHIFGDKPKSPAFKSAMTKLRTLSKKTSSTIKTSRAQHAVNKERRQQDRYNKAVQAAQKRIQLTENLHNLNNLQSYEKRVAQDYKQQRKADHAAEKRYNKFAKNERKMDKFTQLAREGRLKYGQLSDEQVGKITERLALERSARVLGNTEKPKFKTRMKEALQEGMLQGVVQGTAAGMREIAVAKVQNRLKNKHILDKNSAQEAERQKQASRIKNKKTHKEVREDIKDEAYEAQVKAGVGMLSRNQWFGATGAARALQESQNKLNEQKRLQDLNTRVRNEMDLANNSEYQAMLARQHEQKRLQDVQDRINNEIAYSNNADYQNALKQNKDREFAIQQAQNRERTRQRNLEDVEKLDVAAEMAYKYGELPVGYKLNGRREDEIARLSNYYEQRHVKGETKQQKAEREAKEAREAKERERLAREAQRIEAEEQQRKKDLANRRAEMARNAQGFIKMEERVNAAEKERHKEEQARKDKLNEYVARRVQHENYMQDKLNQVARESAKASKEINKYRVPTGTVLPDFYIAPVRRKPKRNGNPLKG